MYHYVTPSGHLCCHVQQRNHMFITPNIKQIEIIGEQIDIVIDDDYCEREEADGLYSGKTIYLKSSYQDVKEYLRVYRHECIHALCDSLGIQLDHNLEEILAHRVSYMVTYEI